MGKIELFANSIKAKIKAFLFSHERINRIVTLVSILRKNPKRFAEQKTLFDKIVFTIIKIALFVGTFFAFRYGIQLFLYITKLQYLSIYDNVFGTYVNIFVFGYLVLSILTASISFISSMYRAKDNVLLLSYPVETRDIFLSKLIGKLIHELKKSVYILAPFFVGVYFNRQLLYGLTPIYFLWTILLSILIPALIVFVSGVLSILFTYISVLFKKINAIKVVFLVAVALGGVYVAIILVNKIPLHLEIFDLWHAIVTDINNFIVSFNEKFTFISKLVTHVLIEKKVGDFFIIFGITLVFALLNIFVAYRFFFTLVYKPLNEKPIRLNRKSRTKQRKNIFLIFLNKEFKTYLRSEDGLVTSIIYILVLPVLLYCLNRIFASFDVSKMGLDMITAINLTISITIITASNISVANSISKEGSEFYLLKVTPIETKQIVLAKIIMNILLTLIASIGVFIACTIIMKTTDITIITRENLLVVSIVTFLVSFAHILWSTELDITHSKLQETIAGQKENKNETISVLMGLGLAFFIGILFFLFCTIRAYGFTLKPIISILIIACFIFITRVILFISKLNAYFDEITM